MMLQNSLYSYGKAIFTTSLDGIAVSKWIGEMIVALGEHVPNDEVDILWAKSSSLLPKCHIATL
jgi:hypothetical protein